MTEKRFTVEDDDADIWEDNHFLAVAYNHTNAKKIAKRFNQLNDENKQLKHKLSQQEMEYATDLHRLSEEIEQLKQNCKNYNWYKQYKTLLNENEELKKENLDLSEELDYYKTKCASLETGLFQADKENEQLKADKQSLIDFIKKEFPKSHKHILEGFND